MDPEVFSILVPAVNRVKNRTHQLQIGKFYAMALEEDNSELPSALNVSGLSADSGNLLKSHFESPRHGGGPIEALHLLNGEYFIVFKDQKGVFTV